MKKYLFTEEEIDLIRFIKLNNPVNIWSNIIQYIFDYEEFHIRFEIECCEKILLDENYEENIVKTENGNHNIFEQYVMSVKIEKVNKPFVTNEASEKISSNEKIIEIYLLKSLYYFTKHKEIKGNKNKTYSNESGIINPNIEINKNIEIGNKYIVDVGIMILTESNNFLNCFIHNNDEDFGINEFYINDNLMETEKGKYEFIKI